MKNNLKIIAYLLGFVIIIILGVIGYKFLSENYTPDEIETETENKIENKTDTLNKAADFEVFNTEGKKVKLSDFFGKPIVVNFWTTWCGPCQSELPEFEEAYKEYNTDVEFLMINLTDGYNDTVESVKEFVKQKNYDFPLYFDSESNAAITYNVYSIPQTLFIDKDGNIIKSYIGMMNKSTLEKYINNLKNK